MKILRAELFLSLPTEFLHMIVSRFPAQLSVPRPTNKGECGEEV